MKSDNYRLQFITHHTNRYDYIDSARLALEGGCRWIQLRMKGADAESWEVAALAVQRLCRDYGATFIIDDNVALAQRIGADGVHLGKEDMPISKAREILGNEYIIGATVNSFEDILRHIDSSTPDYFGCGPFRFTTTKERLAPTLGIEGYCEIIRHMREAKITTPLVAIGGITRHDITALMQCQVDGVALSGSVLKADNPIDEMQNIAQIIKQNIK